MKKLISLLIVVLFLPVVSLADLPDLSGLSFDELVVLRDQLNLAIWNSQEWQEVTVPEGIYVVGKDIPAGHWAIRSAHPMGYFYISVFDKIDALGKMPEPGAYYWDADVRGEDRDPEKTFAPSEVDINLLDGLYIKLSGDAVFTPYAGKPDLGFK